MMDLVSEQEEYKELLGFKHSLCDAGHVRGAHDFTHPGCLFVVLYVDKPLYISVCLS